jgi:hypothetical protein
MKKLFIVLVVLALCVGVASAKLTESKPTYEFSTPNRANAVIWYDDMEGDVSSYSTTDFSAGAAPHFHLDTYMAYEGTYSWWCGNFDYDTDGGYGNSWDDRLLIPTTDLSAATYPILTYAFRHDSEMGYDYTYVQAESMGVFVNLNRGYDGSAPWTDIGLYGFILGTYDNPLNARFRFISDGAWSDQDGLYLSVGGGFMCDIVKVFDYFGGYVYFYDNADDQVHLIPAVPGAAGDFWHLIDRMCPAYSDPHSWWCGDDADTSLIPPMLQNGLFSPLVDISGASACTAFMAVHFAVPTVDNDYCAFYGTAGGDYYGIASYWGDFGSCDGWGGTGLNIGYDITQFDLPPYSWGGFLWIMYTTENGCGPGAGGDAGVMIDDLWYEVPTSPVESVSWGSIKSLYR